MSQNVRITLSVILINKDRKKIWTSSKATRVYQYEKNNNTAIQEGKSKWVSAQKLAELAENDHQLKKPVIVKQILLVSTLGNVYRAVWRICTLMSGWKGLNNSKVHYIIIPNVDSIVDSKWLYRETRTTFISHFLQFVNRLT